MEYAAPSEPDGYTILLATNAYSINYGLYNAIPYDPFKDFVPVCEFGGSPNIFVVKSDLPAKTMKEFIALARANPEKFNASTSPIGTTPQLQLEVLKSRDNLPKLELVVFKGGGDAIEALLAAPCRCARARWRRRSRTSNPARCAGSRSAPSALARSARRAHHGGGRLQGFRLCGRRRAAGAGQTPPANVKWLEAETLKVLVTPKIKTVLPGPLLRARQGRGGGVGRVTKEITLIKEVIDQAGIKKL